MEKKLLFKKTLWHIMRLTFVQMILMAVLCTMAYAYDTNAQENLNKSVSVNAQSVSLKTILAQIEKQTNTRFVYSDTRIPIDKQVSIEANNQKLGLVLNDLFPPLSIRYQASGKYIVLSKIKNEAVGDEPVQEFIQPAFIITGVVTDENNEPLVGASVVLEGTTQGTITDVNGHYKLELTDAQKKGRLLISFVGFNRESIAIGGRSEIKIVLIANSTLDEVVVVGYGVQKKATLTGSISTIKGEEITKNPSPNTSATLAGRLPGLIVNQRSGEPGRDDPSILIRGNGTVGNSSPLIVIDGVPGRGSFSRLNAEDIESISVLKDGSAAIYGNRGANGVILVTTKKGVAGKPKVSFSYNYALQNPTKIPDVLDAVTYANVYNEGQTTPRYSAQDIQKITDGSDPLSFPNTDWVKESLKPYAVQQQMNLQINGGSDKVRYLVSLGSLSQDNNFQNNPTFYKQYNLRAKMDVDISEYLNIGLNINAIPSNRTYSTAGTGVNFINILYANPLLVARYPNGLLAGGRFNQSPLLLDQRGRNTNDDLAIASTFTGTFKIPWVKGLQLDASFNYDINNTFDKNFSIPYYAYQYNVNTTNYDRVLALTDPAVLTDTYSNSKILLYNYRLSYNKVLGKHQVGAMVGLEQQQTSSRRLLGTRRNFLSSSFDQLDFGSNATGNVLNEGSAAAGSYNTYFGRINYDFSSKYFAEFIFRYDGSPIFPESNRYGFFPAGSVGWRISEEKFIKDNFPFIDQLKLRATYGELGNDRVSPYQYAQFFTFPAGANYVFGSADQQGTETGVLPNPNFTWETSKKTDLGLELSMWKGLLGVDFTVFREKRSNILVQRNLSVPKVLGFISLPPENYGRVNNGGYELIVSHRNKIGNFIYSVRANMAYQRSEVIDIDEVPNLFSYQNSTGRPIGSALYYKADGIFNTQEELDGYPHQTGQKLGDIKILDLNEDGKIDANDRFRFDYNNVPKYVFGMNLDFQYKNFDLNMFLYGQSQAYNYDAAFAQLGNADYSNASVYRAEDRWSLTNPNGTMPRSNAYQPGNTTFFLNESTFFRLKTLELGYTLPKALLSKVKMNNLRIFASGYNLLTWSKTIRWSDPENDGNYTSYPQQRIINFGATIGF